MNIGTAKKGSQFGSHASDLVQWHPIRFVGGFPTMVHQPNRAPNRFLRSRLTLGRQDREQKHLPLLAPATPGRLSGHAQQYVEIQAGGAGMGLPIRCSPNHWIWHPLTAIPTWARRRKGMREAVSWGWDQSALQSWSHLAPFLYLPHFICICISIVHDHSPKDAVSPNESFTLRHLAHTKERNGSCSQALVLRMI